MSPKLKEQAGMLDEQLPIRAERPAAESVAPEVDSDPDFDDLIFRLELLNDLEKERELLYRVVVIVQLIFLVLIIRSWLMMR